MATKVRMPLASPNHNTDAVDALSAKKSQHVGEGPTVEYVNDVVLRDLRQCGIGMTADCRITNEGELSADEFVSAFTAAGWSWPRQWHRRNLNRAHDADAQHLEKEVEPGRWIHVVISPGLREAENGSLPGRYRAASDWSLPPRHVELHAEKHWLRPSSFAHLRQFLRDRLWSF
ncbi:MAG TPA: hypothetical protein VHQ64_11480 [Pyrinomonadaceae bacterium]|jgi:hypothetical protein|nr:hypothetical protein [Pyrinomonadaceae bacterium]